jgi:hypothetical protein
VAAVEGVGDCVVEHGLHNAKQPKLDTWCEDNPPPTRVRAHTRYRIRHVRRRSSDGVVDNGVVRKHGAMLCQD